MDFVDVVVVGSGPGGIFCSLKCAEEKKKVLLLEKNNRIGKKLLIAGHGKCNLTNIGDVKHFLTKYGENGKFLKNALNGFKPTDLIDWFSSHGLPLTLVEDTGKYFPHTMRSLDVVELLSNELRKKRVHVSLSSLPKEISKTGELFEIRYTCDGETKHVQCKSLVIATGGLSYPATGTTGDGYLIAKKFGHSIVETRPCLAPVYVDNYSFTDISGISFQNAEVKLIREGRVIATNSGGVLFTHHNLSGPGIIDISRSAKKDDTLTINFLYTTKEDFSEKLILATSTSGKKQLKTFLRDFGLPERFLEKILKLLEINGEKKLSEITKTERLALSNLAAYSFKVTRVGGYEIAMATTGGVNTDEVSSKSMESKLEKNLYFIGEVLDIDGNTGGYNVQASISMGILAAKNIVKN